MGLTAEELRFIVDSLIDEFGMGGSPDRFEDVVAHLMLTFKACEAGEAITPDVLAELWRRAWIERQLSR